MNAITFTTVEQIEQAPTKDLIDFYNSMNPEKPVKKFSDRQTALKRCIALLDSTTTESLIESAKARVEDPAALTEKVANDIKEAHEEFDAEGGEAIDDPDREPTQEEKKFVWPFKAGAQGAPAQEKTEDKPVKRQNIGHASNSAGVAASWANAAVAEARLTRDGVSVTVNGQTTSHKSTRDAFRHYRLLDSKHIRFRGELKASREATYSENGVDYLFKIVSIVK